MSNSFTSIQFLSAIEDIVKHHKYSEKGALPKELNLADSIISNSLSGLRKRWERFLRNPSLKDRLSLKFLENYDLKKDPEQRWKFMEFYRKLFLSEHASDWRAGNIKRSELPELDDSGNLVRVACDTFLFPDDPENEGELRATIGIHTHPTESPMAMGKDLYSLLFDTYLNRPQGNRACEIVVTPSKSYLLVPTVQTTTILKQNDSGIYGLREKFAKDIIGDQMTFEQLGLENEIYQFLSDSTMALFKGTKLDKYFDDVGDELELNFEGFSVINHYWLRKMTSKYGLVLYEAEKDSSIFYINNESPQEFISKFREIHKK